MSSLTNSISLPVAPGVPETRIPRFGLGVYESEGEDCYNSVLWALEVGSVSMMPITRLDWMIAMHCFLVFRRQGTVWSSKLPQSTIILPSVASIDYLLHVGSSAEWYENEEESGRAIRGESRPVEVNALACKILITATFYDRLHEEVWNAQVWNFLYYQTHEESWLRTCQEKYQGIFETGWSRLHVRQTGAKNTCQHNWFTPN